MSDYFQKLNNNPYIYQVEELRLTPEAVNILEASFGKKYADEAVLNCNKMTHFKITYHSQGHLVIGYLIQPHVYEIAPCVIYNRGGMGELGRIEQERIFTDKYSKYSSWGYVTIMSQYSGAGGSEGFDELGGSELDDCLVLKDILSYYDYADADRIGMYGTSRGGTMTYLALSQVSWIKGAVAKAGMANRFRSFDLRKDMKERCRSFFNVDSKEEMIKRSAVYWPDRFCKTTPLLLIHGKKDENVSFQDSVDLHELLIENQVPCKLVLFKDGDHSLSLHKEEESALVREWFDKYVKTTYYN